MLITLVTSLILTMSSFISYPDKILATGIVTTDRPPIKLVAHRTGIIDNILVAPGTIVEKNTPLIYLDNAANRAHINQLLNWIKEYQNKDQGILPPEQLSLGPLQQLHGQLILVYSEYKEVSQQRGTQNQISTISSEIENISRLNQSIAQEVRLYTEEEDLVKKELNRAKLLHKDGLIAKQELELVEAKFSQFLRQNENIEKNKIQNSIRRNQLTLETKKLSEERNTQLQNYRFKIKEILTGIMGAHEKWLTENYIHANIKGIIEYDMDITNFYTLQANQTIGYIIPIESQNEKYVKAIAPTTGISKLDTSSKAIIKLEAYPYKEFGSIEATIEQMSLIPIQNKEGVALYQIRIPLGDTLYSTYNKTIEYRPDMRASVELISKEKSILSRVMSQFLDLIHNQ